MAGNRSVEDAPSQKHRRQDRRRYRSKERRLESRRGRPEVRATYVFIPFGGPERAIWHSLKRRQEIMATDEHR
jgi:hypothetical protein